MSDQIPLPTIDQFAEELVKEPRWYDLGVFLCVPTYELDVIARDYQGTQRRLIELFKCFPSRGKVVSWNDIVDALTKMQHKDLADQLRQKYIPTTASSYPLSPTRSEKQESEEAGKDSQGMETGSVSEVHSNKLYIDKEISKEFDEVITAFAKLVLEIKRALQRNTISIREIQVVLQEVYEIDPLSTEEATLDKVFARMRQHYCFLNYRALAHLVDMFLSNEKPLQQLLVDYTNKLDKFKESVKIKDLMKLIKEKRDLYGNQKIIHLKTRDFWGKVPLSKFERLAKLMFENLYDCAAQIRIEDGCICVSWVIPDIDTSVLDTVSPDLLKIVGVISLKIDDEVLYEGPNEGCHILESAFLQAVAFENVRAIELLLAVSTHPSEVANMGIYNGWTPLMIGSQRGCNEVVKLLLNAKANPNACTVLEETAIYIASAYGHPVVVSTLLTSGADPNMAKSDGWTPLMIGSQEGHNEVVVLLLKAKVNPNACLKNGVTAIYIACQNGHSVVVSTLLRSGADPNLADSHCWTPLMIGSQEGNNEAVEILLKAKVNPNACLKNGITAIYIASKNGHSVVVSTLLAFGANPNMGKHDGWTPLMIGSRNGHNEVVEQLLEANVDPNACLKDGKTSIYIASEKGHSVVVSTLLAFGANPISEDSDGYTLPIIGSYSNC